MSMRPGARSRAAMKSPGIVPTVSVGTVGEEAPSIGLLGVPYPAATRCLMLAGPGEGGTSLSPVGLHGERLVKSYRWQPSTAHAFCRTEDLILVEAPRPAHTQVLA
jgi:hypothetical protein